MADAKTSELVELLGSELSPTTDWITVTDVSAGAAGSKKMHPSELLANPIVSSVITCAAGSAAAPSISPSGEPDTGIYFGAADEVDVALGGAKRLSSTVYGLDVIPAASEYSLGLDSLTNGDFTGSDTGWTAGAGWAYGSNKEQHTAGNTATLTQAITATTSQYLVSVTITGRTAGSITVNFSTVTESHVGKTASFSDVLTSTVVGSNTLTITPTTDFDGAIDAVSLKKINQLNTATGLRVLNSDGSQGGAIIRPGGIGLNNIWFGYYVGGGNISGTNNVGVGNLSLSVNGSGNYNVGIGYAALTANTIGTGNIALGYQANAAARNSTYNVAIGYAAMGTAGQGVSDVVAIGFEAAKAATGTANVCIGSNSGTATTSGNRNVYIGAASGFANTTGSLNVAIGRSAGRYYGSGTSAMTDAENSIYIGYQTRGLGNDDDKAIVIGYDCVGLGANTTVIGQSTSTLALMYGAHVLATVAAPAGVADMCHIYSADQAAGNACPHIRTEHGETLKLFQGAAVADATGAGDVVAQLNALLARLRAHGLIAT